MENDTEIGFKVVMKKEVEERIRWLTKNYDKEISAWLGGELTEEGILIDDLMFPEQEVGGASVDTDQKQLIKLRKEYGNRCLRIIGHWHSHNSMSAHWSTDDDKFIKEHMHERDFRVFLVSSIRDGIRVRVEIRKPIGISIDEVELEIENDNKELEEEMKEIIKKKVKEVKIGEVKCSNWWDYKKKEEEEEKEEEKVKIIKKLQNVEVDDLDVGIYNKIEDMFPFDKKVTFYANNTVKVIYKIGNKKEARKFRDEIKEAISIIKETKEDKFVSPYQDDWYDEMELRKGYLN